MEKKKKPKLDFIHIPKTAGQKIWKIGRTYDIDWRGYMNKDSKLKKLKDKNYVRVYYRHIPYDNWNEFPIGSDNFCVVRNPFDRLVSAYKYFLKTRGWRITKKDHSDQWHIHHMNCWIHENLNKMLTEPWIHNAHLIPQYKYVYDKKGKRICNNVLRFENIEKEFNNLMIKYDMKPRFTKEKINKGYEKSVITVENLSNMNIRLVKKIYKKDFELFNYHFRNKQKKD